MAVCGENSEDVGGGDGGGGGGGGGSGGGLSSTSFSAPITASALSSGEAVGSTAVPCRCRRAAARYSTRFGKRSDGYRNESRGSDIVCGGDRIGG